MNKLIAIIDDDSEFSLGVREFLQGRNYKVDAFHSYNEAVHKLDERYSVVIIDVHLVDGDGIELVQLLQRRFPQIKKIVITGQDSLPKRLRSFGVGADDYMMKPIFPCELEARVKRLLREEIATQQLVKESNLFTKAELDVLAVLTKNVGRPVSVESFEKLGLTRSAIYTLIYRLKRKVQPSLEIKTCYGRGWYICND